MKCSLQSIKINPGFGQLLRWVAHSDVTEWVRFKNIKIKTSKDAV